jgi:hypothetical protein
MALAPDQGWDSSQRPLSGPRMPDMTLTQLVVRCLIERKGDQWQAFSLEFGLAVQGDSAVEVRRKLESMLECYVRDALVGEDREHAFELLRRKATWRVYFHYYLAWSRSHLTGSSAGKIYREPLPLEPKHCPA